jgi:hypothetical protein
MTPDLARFPNRAHDTDTIAERRWCTTLLKPKPVAVSNAGGLDSPIANHHSYANVMGSDWA